MKNRNVGILIIGISILVILMVFLFSNAMNQYINDTCPLVHEQSNFCPAKTTIKQQTYLSITISGVIFIIGLVLFFSKPEEKIIIKKIKQKIKKIKLDTSNLKPEEKKILKMVISNKTIFQADLIDKTNFGKAKMTRILDRLEGQGFVERKRRGMTNVVVLKE